MLQWGKWKLANMCVVAQEWLGQSEEMVIMSFGDEVVKELDSVCHCHCHEHS